MRDNLVSGVIVAGEFHEVAQDIAHQISEIFEDYKIYALVGTAVNTAEAKMFLPKLSEIKGIFCYQEADVPDLIRVYKLPDFRFNIQDSTYLLMASENQPEQTIVAYHLIPPDEKLPGPKTLPDFLERAGYKVEREIDQEPLENLL